MCPDVHLQLVWQRSAATCIMVLHACSEWSMQHAQRVQTNFVRGFGMHKSKVNRIHLEKCFDLPLNAGVAQQEPRAVTASFYSIWLHVIKRLTSGDVSESYLIWNRKERNESMTHKKIDQPVKFWSNRTKHHPIKAENISRVEMLSRNMHIIMTSHAIVLDAKYKLTNKK